MGSERATTPTSTAAGRIGRTAAIAAAIGSRSWSPCAGTTVISVRPGGTSRVSVARARVKKSAVAVSGCTFMPSSYAEQRALVRYLITSVVGRADVTD